MCCGRVRQEQGEGPPRWPTQPICCRLGSLRQVRESAGSCRSCSRGGTHRGVSERVVCHGGSRRRWRGCVGSALEAGRLPPFELQAVLTYHANRPSPWMAVAHAGQQQPSASGTTCSRASKARWAPPLLRCLLLAAALVLAVGTVLLHESRDHHAAFWETALTAARRGYARACQSSPNGGWSSLKFTSVPVAPAHSSVSSGCAWGRLAQQFDVCHLAVKAGGSHDAHGQVPLRFHI